jgi:hypothetical protein
VSRRRACDKPHSPSHAQKGKFRSVGRYQVGSREKSKLWSGHRPCDIRLQGSQRACRPLTVPNRPLHHATSARVPATGQRLNAPPSAAHLIVFPALQPASCARRRETWRRRCATRRRRVGSGRDPLCLLRELEHRRMPVPLLRAWPALFKLERRRPPCAARDPPSSTERTKTAWPLLCGVRCRLSPSGRDGHGEGCWL